MGPNLQNTRDTPRSQGFHFTLHKVHVGLGNSYGMKYIRSSHHPSKDVGSLSPPRALNMNVTFSSTAGSMSNPQDKDQATASQLPLPKQGFTANIIPSELYKYPPFPANCTHFGSAFGHPPLPGSRASPGTLYRDEFQSISSNSIAPASLVAGPTTAPNPTLHLASTDCSESTHIHTKSINNLAAPSNMNINTTTA